MSEHNPPMSFRDSLGCLWMIGIVAYGLTQLAAGYLGLTHHLGIFWAILAIIATFMLRFPLPVTIGAFFGAMNVWGWPWYGALLFAFPGLAFMVVMISGVFASSLPSFNR